MEEMMTMVMMKMSTHSHEPAPPKTHTQDHNPNIPMITTSICPTWKLYENPFYIFHQQDSTTTTTDHKQIHRLHLPISSRKIAASFLDLTFIKPHMESELESERKARKKMESLNKRLARKVAEERRGREALERAYHDLDNQLSAHKAEIMKMKRDMDEERKMLRTAEVIREERVQMKLSEAKIFLEEKLSELQINGNVGSSSSSSGINRNDQHQKLQAAANSSMTKSCVEMENPHIKRGIKGFVEFPKVVRAIGCRSSKHLGSKLECQKAQLKILLKQKGPVRFTGLIAR